MSMRYLRFRSTLLGVNANLRQGNAFVQSQKKGHKNGIIVCVRQLERNAETEWESLAIYEICRFPPFVNAFSCCQFPSYRQFPLVLTVILSIGSIVEVPPFKSTKKNMCFADEMDGQGLVLNQEQLSWGSCKV